MWIARNSEDVHCSLLTIKSNWGLVFHEANLHGGSRIQVGNKHDFFMLNIKCCQFNEIELGKMEEKVEKE